jgi:hypothetical protein
VDHDQRRPVHAGNGLCHRERLARAGDAQQHLVVVAALQAFHELADGALLVPGKREIGDQVEAVVQGGHRNSPWY